MDYGRANFSISQTNFPDTSVPAQLIPILPPGEILSAPNAKHNGISTGALAGIIVGTIVVFAVIGAMIYLFVRKRRAAAYKKAEIDAAEALTFTELDPPKLDDKPELDAVATVAPKPELGSPPPQSSTRLPELGDSSKPSQLLPGSRAPAEMYSTQTTEQIRSCGSGGPAVYELPGTEVGRAELGGGEVEGVVIR